jgi:hypothetical protein
MTDLDAIAHLLATNAGFGIEFFGGMLAVRQLESGRFEVSRETRAKPDANSPGLRRTVLCEEFADARDAATRFLDLRVQHKIGFDFEWDDAES